MGGQLQLAQLLRLSPVCRMISPTRTPALSLTPIPQIEEQRTRRTPTCKRRSDKVFFSSQPLLLLHLPLILLRILPQPMLVVGRDPRHHLEVSQILQALSQHQSASSAGTASTHPRESTSVSTDTLSVMIAGPSCRSAVFAVPTLPAAPPAWSSSLGIFTKSPENSVSSRPFFCRNTYSEASRSSLGIFTKSLENTLCSTPISCRNI